MTDGRRQYDLDRFEAQRAQETEDWLARMREERAAEEAAKAEPPPIESDASLFRKASPKPRPLTCCAGGRRYGYHDAYCSANFSRSAGS